MGSFKDVVGHRDVIQYLQNAVAENRVSQAYIVNGERGTGKKMLAKLRVSDRSMHIFLADCTILPGKLGIKILQKEVSNLLWCSILRIL